jgi:hypothetical protein
MQRQAGQALVFGLFIVFVGSIALFFLFNTGQVSAEKQRVTNTADAAAYSAALWRARVLNYHAYSNRAMIANEVAVAQTLTLVSEVQHFKNFTACLASRQGDGNRTCNADARLLAYVPYVGQALQYASTALNYYDRSLRYVATAEIAMRSGVINRGLSASQEALHLTTNFAFIQGSIARQVTLANDSNFTVAVVPDQFSVAGNNQFTTRYSSRNQRERLANVARSSLDPYSQSRGFDTRIPIICYRYIKRGGTDLSTDLERWEATDNLAEWRGSWFFGCRRWRERPMSWASQVGNGRPIDRDPGDVRRNPNALGISRSNGVTHNHSGYAGIQSFRDLNYAGLANQRGDTRVRNPMSEIALVVRQAGGAVRTANTLNVGVGRLRMTENFNRGRISTIAAAQVYFRRPAPRADGRIELPSLFNPYWQARLTEPTLTQRLTAEAL